MAMFVLAYAIGSRTFKRNISLSAEVAEKDEQLSQTQSDLEEAVHQSEVLTDSLVKTLWNSGCLMWKGGARLTNEGLIWSADLQYEPGFEWLKLMLESGGKFHNIWDSLRHPDDQEVWKRMLGKAMRSGEQSLMVEYRIELENYKTLWFSEQITITAVDATGFELSAFVHDVSENRQHGEEIRKLAFYDTTTGLINRTRIHDLISEYLGEGKFPTVIGVQISNFRNINESWGADVADKLLKQFGELLQDEVGSVGAVGRLAGDDYVVIIPNAQDVDRMVQKVYEACQRPVHVEKLEIAKICRLGYVSAEEGDTAIGLIRKANLALENSRKLQAHFPVAYKPEMSFRAKMRVELETAMRQALNDHEFYLMFQPIYSNSTGKMVKAEALLRWNSSRFGAVSPGTFVPIAEESDVIFDLGAFVISETARCLANVQKEALAPEFQISLNLSLRQLQNPSCLTQFRQAIDKHDLMNKHVMIEITESSIMHDAAECAAMLNALQDQGFLLAIDDFGTGYSSLSTLAALPFNCLKIDKRFVDGIGLDRKQEEVLQTIVRLARALNLQIVAEGIEQKQQFEYLSELGVEFSQGYYFAKPLPIEELLERLKRENQAAA
jgi:diguanylate cyclase (GGDEF)-like protein